ncbi:MAG: SUMF1/EgtB/PvdO family nonheme iron enzyme [Magnetococcales bacterium]|nr:SUMF1/EgtB/PvdO family nonheme iron enzyme [Magnetococcales bacterium]
MAITWLHLSDVHFTNNKEYDQEVILTALIDSMQWFREQHSLRPDLIFLTGDLAYSGERSQYESAEKFLDALIVATGIDKGRLFIVPGNHDADRKKARGLARTLVDDNDANQYFSPDGLLHHISDKQRAFADWYNGYFGKKFPEDSSCGPVEMIEIDGCKIAILPLNSALFSQDDRDQGKLWLGRRALDREIDKLRPLNADLKIALIHHPFDWLNDHEKANIKTKLADAVDIVLRGHLHENDIENTIGSGGSLFHMAAGAGYQTSKYPNRALFATVEAGRITVFPIHYVDKPKESWVHDTGFFARQPGYVQSFSLPKVKGGCAVVSPSTGAKDNQSLEKVRGGCAVVSPSTGVKDVQQNPDIFLKSGTLPEWAEALGLDRHGFWATFSLAGVKQKMRWIPPGRFWMGSPEDEPGRFEYEGPRHEVTIEKGYWLFDTPCTQALWQAVMDDNPSEFQTPDRPVEGVSWDNVQEFLQRINNRLPGLDLVLPSESQWEYACRAGTDTALYTGDIEILGDNNAPVLSPIAWYGGNSGVDFELDKGVDSKGWPEKQYPHEKAGTHPVGRKAPNSWGLYDMLGNVWEWCADYWHNSYEGAPVDGAPWLDEGEAGGSRVFRGGSWSGSARLVRSACRLRRLFAARHVYLGFRCARAHDRMDFRV